ncbi:MAG: hypothetical protein H6608_00930 [Flavobacteriales bacterium]|nr:hypothetical protein [Bacteroidota bacterium]MCB9239670.1 hypothetical protein [Flavobacteriales bacterium]
MKINPCGICLRCALLLILSLCTVLTGWSQIDVGGRLQFGSSMVKVDFQPINAAFLQRIAPSGFAGCYARFPRANNNYITLAFGLNLLNQRNTIHLETTDQNGMPCDVDSRFFGYYPFLSLPATYEWGNENYSIGAGIQPSLRIGGYGIEKMQGVCEGKTIDTRSILGTSLRTWCVGPVITATKKLSPDMTFIMTAHYGFQSDPINKDLLATTFTSVTLGIDYKLFKLKGE